jgi:hypothetical protein
LGRGVFVSSFQLPVARYQWLVSVVGPHVTLILNTVFSLVRG